jgi:hypothetical protein
MKINLHYFQTSKDLQIPLLHPAELSIIDDILEIATMYKKLEEFIERQNDIGIQLGLKKPSKTHGPNGLYVTSVANGIQEILNEYLRVVADLETKILENPYVTLTEMLAELESFRAVFTALVSLTKKVENY